MSHRPAHGHHSRFRWRHSIALTLGLLGITAATSLPSAPTADAVSASGCSTRVVQSTLEVPDRGAPGGRREIRVYRPTGPDSARVPVLYLLPGLPGSDRDFGQAALTGQLQSRYCAGQRAVVAVPDGNVTVSSASHVYDTEWANDPGGRFDLETFVTRTMVGAVEGRAVRRPSMRAIGGFSMGGFAAASIAMRHPSEYSTVLAIAGYFHIDDPDNALGTSAGAKQAHDPDDLVAAGRQLHFYLADGDRDDQPVVAGESQRFAAKLSAHKVGVRLSIVSGGHNLHTVSEALPGALSYWHAVLTATTG